MKNKVMELNKEQIKYLHKFRDLDVYNASTQIIYHGQIPTAAFVLLEGEIKLKNARDKLILSCCPCALIGFHQLCKREAFKYTAEIQPGSKVLIIDRSTAFEILEDLPRNNIDFEFLDLVS